MTSVVVAIQTCSICGSSRIAPVLQLPISDFLKDRASYYRLETFGLTGTEIMGYVRCLDCSFIFASPTLDASMEVTTYNDAKAGQAEFKQEWMSDADAAALYQTHHKWVDLNPFVLALGFHFERYQKPRNSGKKLRLLDIGCGFGHTLELARMFALDGTGYDLDKSRIAACRAKGLRVVDDPGAIDGRFDVIISSNVIEHVFDLRGYVQMVSRHLSDHGVFVFSGLERSVIDVELKQPRFKLLHPIEHRNVLTRGSLSKLLRDSGLRFVTRRELLATMKRVRSKAPLYVPYLLKSGFVAVNGIFSAVARRAD